MMYCLGVDSKEVAEEFNLFCEGEHPMYPGVHFDGTKICLIVYV